jgi:hypothetical protein
MNCHMHLTCINASLDQIRQLQPFASLPSSRITGSTAWGTRNSTVELAFFVCDTNFSASSNQPRFLIYGQSVDDYKVINPHVLEPMIKQRGEECGNRSNRASRLRSPPLPTTPDCHFRERKPRSEPKKPSLTEHGQ